MRNNQENDEFKPPIITLETMSEPEEETGPNSIREDEADESRLEEKQIHKRQSKNIYLRNELQNLASSYNQEASKEQDRLREQANLIQELSQIVDDQTIANMIHVIEEETQYFEEAYNHPNKIQREKWRTAIEKVLHEMNKWGVWNILKQQKFL